MSGRRISGADGSRLVTGTGAVTGISREAIYVRENTVIATLSGTNDNITTTNLLTLLNISGATLVQGDFFTVPEGYKITAITLTSGSVILY